MMLPQASTLPLSEGGIICHAKLVPEGYELFPRQRLGQDIYYLLIYKNVLKSCSSSLDCISNEVISHLDVLLPVMKQKVL
jgi:hypothetical protein